MTLSESILKTGADICKAYRDKPELLKQGSLIPGLILVYWEIKNEIGSISTQEDKVRLWARAKELRPEASKSQLIDTSIALLVYNRITGEYL